MRRWFVSVGSLACLLGVIGGTVVANAGSSITSPETFTVLGSVTKTGLDDSSEPGRVSPGDVVVLAERVTDENGANVGKARIQCTVHVARWEICIATWDITDRGQIVAEGTMPPYDALDTPPFDLAVTGGTGDFANVRGTVHVEVVEVLDGPGERDTFSLIP
jgi:hypothetical protein